MFFEFYVCIPTEDGWERGKKQQSSKTIFSNCLLKLHFGFKFGETCKYYHIDFDEEQYHSAIYDVTKTLEILNRMECGVG